jgi:twitching motility protein PilT
VLEGIISQQLIPKKNGSGRALAVEIFIPTPAIRNLIREDKAHQIYSMMQTGQVKFGMQTMNQSLFELFKKGLISYEDALTKSTMPDELMNMMQRASIGKG